MTRRALGAPAPFPPRQRVRLENLACSDPAEHGLALTHWSVRSVQRAAVHEQICEAGHFTTVADIGRTADLHPHRVRSWKTTVWDEAAIQQAAQLLWCSERVDWLWAHGQIVLCIDEKPNLHVLERARPIQRCRPGQIEQQECDYRRHGTMNLLGGLRVHDGWLWAACLDANDGDHFRPA